MIMKRSMKVTVLGLAIISLTLATCGPEVKFTEPQPKGISNLQSIPAKYQGRFKNKSDSSLLIIDSQSIMKEWKSTERMHRDSLDKELKMHIKRDTSFKYWDKQLMGNSKDYLLLTIRLNNDSAKVKITGYETLFAVSDSQLVRIYKNFCFLNSRTTDKYWLVKTLRIQENQLDFSDLINVKEIDKIKAKSKVIEVKDTAQKVVDYHMTPTLREMRRILKQKKFDNSFKKI
jgi:hypothetical protein